MSSNLMEEAELQALKKGKVSLASAMHKLDIVGASFTRLQDLERAVASQESVLDEVKGMLKYFVSSSGLRAALDQFTHDIHDSLNSRFASFRDAVEKQFDVRPDQTTIEAALATKANAISVSSLQDQMRSLRGQFETLSSSVFESFKIEVKRGLASKLDAGMLRDTMRDVTESEQWQAFTARLDEAERRIEAIPQSIQVLPQEHLEQIDTMQMFPDPESPSYKLMQADSPVVLSLRSSKGLSLEQGAAQSPRNQSSRASLGVDWGKVISGVQQDLAECRGEIGVLKEDTEARITELEAERHKLKATIRELDSVKRKLAALEPKSETPKQRSSEGPSPQWEKLSREQESLTKRTVRLETDVSGLQGTTQFLKTHSKDKLNEFVKSLHFLHEQREMLSRDLAALRTQSTETDLKHNRALAHLKEELLTLRGPMLDMLATQARESGALNTEIKRHQELFRTLVGEYSGTRALSSISPSLKASQQLSTQRVEFQPRVQSASPGVRLRKKLNTLATPRKSQDSEVKASMKAIERKLSTSQRSTPRRLLDIEKSLALI